MKFERVQHQTALAVTSSWHGLNRSKLYEELGWENLSDRRMCRRILQIHNILNNKSPSYLKEKPPPNRRPFLHSANVSNSVREIRGKSSRYMNTFFPGAIAS